MHRVQIVTAAILGLALVSEPGIAADQARSTAPAATTSQENIVLAEASSAKSSRRGRRGSAAAVATEQPAQQVRNSARRKDRKSAQRSVSTDNGVVQTARASSRRGNRGANHESGGAVPTHLERFLAGVFAPANPWEKAMVLVASETTGNQIWVEGIQPGPAGTFIGVIAKDARVGQSDAPISAVSFARTHIRDWGFVEAGQGYGFVTLRQQEDSVENTVVASFLAESAFPAGW